MQSPSPTTETPSWQRAQAAAALLLDLAAEIEAAGDMAEQIAAIAANRAAEANPAYLPTTLRQTVKRVSTVLGDLQDIVDASNSVEADLTHGHEPDPADYQSLPLGVLGWVKEYAARRRAGITQPRKLNPYTGRWNLPLVVLGQGTSQTEVQP
jgi:hypothetical protein